MIADNLLSRLDKVKTTGAESWMACCPAHDDKKPSLSIKSVINSEGVETVILKCWTGCEAEEILGAVGMTFDDLYPPRIDRYQPTKPNKRPFPAKDIMHALADDMMLILVCAKAIVDKKPITDEGYERVAKAVTRFQVAIQEGGFNERR